MRMVETRGRHFQVDQGYGGRGALGLIVLATDETLEPEIAPVFQAAGRALYHSRIPSRPTVTRATLLQMAQDLPAAAGLLPKSVTFGAIGYGCTSAATVIGPDAVTKAVQSAHPNVPVTNPISAVIAACQRLGVKKLGFVTPYVPDVSSAMRQFLESKGIEISGFTSFEQTEERVVARISETSVMEAILEVSRAGDAVFTSCTNLRAFNIIRQAEAQIGKPVISSNSALAWHMLRLSGATGPSHGPGRLFQL